MPRGSRPQVSINKPQKSQAGPDTRFQIDYDWWTENDRSLESYLNSKLGQEVSLEAESNQIDLIDPVTGQVHPLSGFEYAIQNYVSQLPDDFIRKASLVDGTFFVLLANGNRPMTATEIAEQVGRSPDVIFKTLGSAKTYLGIRTPQ